ncbi:MAG: electron transfer flavoprotein subunit beta/FixA family protein, partial [Bacillota bacterium]
ESSEAVINPYDLHAVEEAVRIKNKTGGKITAISMGIPAVEKLLKKAMAYGIDESILLSDKAFAGADTLATSYTLARAIKKYDKFDLIICGKQATDGDTAQVGPELAEKLGIPQLAYIRNIKEIQEEYITGERKIENKVETFKIYLPALITVTREINQPGFPSISGIIRAENKEVIRWQAEDINADKNRIGLDGSPTRVIDTYIPEKNKNQEIIKGSAARQAQTLVDKLESIYKSQFWN